jgi:predicted nucleic acid-binding protein
MIVVADASPLNYLIQVQCDIFLHELYRRVFVPAAVMEELRHPQAPTDVASWLQHLPSWIEIRTVRPQQDTALEALDPGEREAIQLAEEQHADLLLIDERLGRSEARRRGISTTVTLGILLAAERRGLLDAESIFRRLIQETTFRATPEVQKTFLTLYRQSGKRSE